MTYHIPPTLKRILEDKRVRGYGIPTELYQIYLSCEQFVINASDYTLDDHKNIVKTFNDMKELELHFPPYNDFVLHIIAPYVVIGRTIVSIFYHGTHAQNTQSTPINFFLLSESEKEVETLHLMLEKEVFSKELNSIAGVFLTKFVVTLATRNIVKEHHECKKSQQPHKGRPHKKGSSGYTILCAPEAHEVGDGTKIGGWHPRPHFRRGHIRKLHPEDKTRWVWVSPCFVNGEPETARKSYLVAS